MGGDGGPSASEIVREQRRQEVLDFLRLKHPDVAKDYDSRKRGEALAAFIGGVLGLWTGFSATPYNAPGPVPFVIPYFGAALGGAVGYAIGMLMFRSYSIIDQYAPELVQRRHNMEDLTVKIDAAISEREASRIGHNVVATGGSTVVIDSKHVQIINDIRNKNPDIAEALTTISGMVEHLKSAGASEALDNLSQAVQEPNPSKSKIRAFWNDLVSIAPQVASLGEAAAKITKLFI